MESQLSENENDFNKCKNDMCYPLEMKTFSMKSNFFSTNARPKKTRIWSKEGYRSTISFLLFWKHLFFRLIQKISSFCCISLNQMFHFRKSEKKKLWPCSSVFILWFHFLCQTSAKKNRYRKNFLNMFQASKIEIFSSLI